ncbi:hypothetical protein PCASD_17314 [Puccinia coronata f. sp. avenae]|uniref:P-type ATPase A domain-containing protein n=1 Tax=Puccinia coronata f. sp. avenae TaxID=200324 RepID=A0A2N5U2M7_9BASI|nr:hypothetical protein PCASD_17314 [Puccinia coronata f. sp. avenae]
MKKGEWLLFKNSNLCSASVLDRLNPLFEGAGRRQLAEKGMTNRGIDTVTPHNDFRIVFAVNPRYGKLSHAMRNRGVEIAFLPDPQFSVWSLPMPLYTTSINSAENIHDPVMRWTAQALIHSPTAYPLLSRTLDHYLPSSSPNHTLKLLLDRLLQSDIQSVMSRWAQINRATHFFIGKAPAGSKSIPMSPVCIQASYCSMPTITLVIPPVALEIQRLKDDDERIFGKTKPSHRSRTLIDLQAQDDGSKNPKPIHSRGSWKVRHWIALSDGEDCSPDWQDFVATMALLLINSGILVITERSAGNAVKALMDSLASEAQACRNGQWSEIDLADLVPGDIVAFKIGDVAPGDCCLYDAVNCGITLTGAVKSVKDWGYAIDLGISVDPSVNPATSKVLASHITALSLSSTPANLPDTTKRMGQPEGAS